jgi:hypothetical protein
MSSLEKIIDKETQTAFDKKVVSAAQHLHPYIKHRLYIAESTKILPENMFSSHGIIDESIAKLYEKGYDIDMDIMAIKLKLFRIVDTDLDALFKNESFHKDTISTNSILEEELDDLEEKFTVDADLDYIMNEELNDISYKQDRKHKHLFLYDDNNASILSALDLEDISSVHSKKLLGKFYTWLPLNVTGIVDLYAFGKLSFEDISKIKKIEVKRIEKIMDAVKKSFRKNLD